MGTYVRTYVDILCGHKCPHMSLGFSHSVGSRAFAIGEGAPDVLGVALKKVAVESHSTASIF